MPRSNLVAFVWEKVIIIYFSETKTAYDLKVGRCIQLNQSYRSVIGQGQSLTLAKGHSVFKLKSWFSRKLLVYLKANTM